MDPEMLTKTQATKIITEATGYGRRPIERAFATLAERGDITLQRTFNNLIAWLISREDVDKVIAYLKAGPKD